MGVAQPGRLGLSYWRDGCVNLYKEGLLMTEPNLQKNAFKRDRPLASAHGFAASKQDDKVSNTGQEEPATTVPA